MVHCWNGVCKFTALLVLLKAEVFPVQNILFHMMGYLKFQVFGKAVALYWKGMLLFHPAGSNTSLR